MRTIYKKVRVYLRAVCDEKYKSFKIGFLSHSGVEERTLTLKHYKAGEKSHCNFDTELRLLVVEGVGRGGYC